MNQEIWAREFFRVVDSRQPQKIAQYMTEDVRLQMANMNPSIRVESLKQVFKPQQTGLIQ